MVETRGVFPFSRTVRPMKRKSTGVWAAAIASIAVPTKPRSPIERPRADMKSPARMAMLMLSLKMPLMIAMTGLLPPPPPAGSAFLLESGWERARMSGAWTMSW